VTAFPPIELPDDLAIAAAEIPGLKERLVSFIRAEVSVHRRKQSKRSPAVLEVVKRAREKAEQMRAEGVTPEQARTGFVKHYMEMQDQTAEKP
jgi:hypothetical protein